MYTKLEMVPNLVQYLSKCPWFTFHHCSRIRLNIGKNDAGIHPGILAQIYCLLLGKKTTSRNQSIEGLKHELFKTYLNWQ